MKLSLDRETNFDFIEDIKQECGQDVRICYQCRKCTAGCPTGMDMEYAPHQVIRLLQLGQHELILNSEASWLCVSCETCTTRCPQGLDITKVMDAIRIIAQRQGKKLKVYKYKFPLFNRIFLKNLEKYGRVYELSLLTLFNIKSGQLFKDAGLGVKIFLKGKIGLFPHRIKDVKGISKIFSKIRKMEGLPK